MRMAARTISRYDLRPQIRQRRMLLFTKMTPGAQTRAKPIRPRGRPRRNSRKGRPVSAGRHADRGTERRATAAYYTTDSTDPTDSPVRRIPGRFRFRSRRFCACAFEGRCTPSYMDTQSYLFAAKTAPRSSIPCRWFRSHNLTSDEAGILVEGLTARRITIRTGSARRTSKFRRSRGQADSLAGVRHAPAGRPAAPSRSAFADRAQRYADSPSAATSFQARLRRLQGDSDSHPATTRTRPACAIPCCRRSRRTRACCIRETEVCVVSERRIKYYNLREAVNPTLICLERGLGGRFMTGWIALKTTSCCRARTRRSRICCI